MDDDALTSSITMDEAQSSGRTKNKAGTSLKKGFLGTIVARFRSADNNSESVFAAGVREREYIETYCGPLMTVSDFRTHCFVKVGEGALSYPKKKKSEKELAQQMGVSEDVVKELQEGCDPKHLHCADETPFVNGDCAPQEVPKDSHLAIHHYLVKAYSKPSLNLPKPLKYHDLSNDSEHKRTESKSVYNRDLLDQTEILLSVSVYHPRRRRKDQEFLVVTRQSLTALRDAIVCQTDLAPTMDCSENPSLEEHAIKRANEVYKSGYFFIEGMFYNDMRDPKNLDYSKGIIEWAKDGQRWQNPRLGVFRSRKMEETTFEDIKFRLGAPYLYCHQGDCEHLMFITDMRVITEFDPKKMSDYPILITRESKFRRKCSVCDILTAKWLTREDELAYEDPSFFCDTCFEYLHYDEDKKKVCRFKAYPYEKKIMK